MQKIDIKEIENIKEKLDDLDIDEVLYVDEDGASRFVIMPIDLFDSYLESNEGLDKLTYEPHIKILGADNVELSYEEYELIKKQINDAFDKTFKPKREKLN